MGSLGTKASTFLYESMVCAHAPFSVLGPFRRFGTHLSAVAAKFFHSVFHTDEPIRSRWRAPSRFSETAAHEWCYKQEGGLSLWQSSAPQNNNHHGSRTKRSLIGMRLVAFNLCKSVS